MAVREDSGTSSVPQEESTSQVTSHLLEECRMVLPGIQALFGFQLIAVFNGKFWELPEGHRLLHLLAIDSVATSVALVMTPAAYHRRRSVFDQPTVHSNIIISAISWHGSIVGRNLSGFLRGDCIGVGQCMVEQSAYGRTRGSFRGTMVYPSSACLGPLGTPGQVYASLTM